MGLAIFTSINIAYLPKARVLAKSVKQVDKSAKFYLVLSDKIPEWFEIDKEPFDKVITIDELEIPDKIRWIFKHTVVELCTAVKANSFIHLMKHFNEEKVLYLDPDIVVFSQLDVLEKFLDKASIILTPHQTTPEKYHEAILDNEVCSLRHGVFNLGFLGVKNSQEGLKFLSWWNSRLLEYCYDDIAAGLFTDQRWIDLVPAFFEDFFVIRSPQFNVSTWNLTNRKVTGDFDKGFFVNGKPLGFFHFSGWDSGDHKVMLKKYAGDSISSLKELQKWYDNALMQNGQNELKTHPWHYGFYENGEEIKRIDRILYRIRKDLQDAFPNPFEVKPDKQSYYQWCRHHAEEEYKQIFGTSSASTDAETEVIRLRKHLDEIQKSRSWQLAQKLSRLYHLFKF